MATREQVVQLVQQTLASPIDCIAEISKHVVWNYTVDVPYSHIWTSYIAHKVGLGNTQAPLTASCDVGANWFRRRKRYKLGQAYGGDYTPQPGDYVYVSSTYEQTDVTDVGIVLSCDGALMQYVHWNEGQPRTVTWYVHDADIIGFGIPDYEDVNKIDMPMLATKGNAIAIIQEMTTIWSLPTVESISLGTLSKGWAVEVLEVTPTGWIKVVWGLSTKNGYGYIDNTKFIHKIIHDEIPYQKYKGFRIGDKVQFVGGKVFKQPNKNGKSKVVGPFTGKITGDKSGMYFIEDTNKPFHGWVDKKSVDFISDIGYTKRKGMVDTDQAYLRIGPGREFTKVQKWPQMVKGNIVDVLGVTTDDDNNEWYYVVIEGVKGYIEDYCISDIEA